MFDEFSSARELNQHQKETDHGYSLACKVSISYQHPIHLSNFVKVPNF